MNNQLKKEILESLKKIDGYEEFAKENGFDYTKVNEMLGMDVGNFEDDLVPSTKRGLGYRKLTPDAVAPKYNYPSDSGFDLHSVIDVTVPPLGRVLIPTGLQFDIDDGYEIQVRTKSGLAINQGIMVLNSPGTVDSGYTGECKVPIFNTNSTEFKITKGMKVAQAVLCPVVNGAWVDLVEMEEITDKDRGSNGFGSTGIK
jgi:dUTP pyrophosphatase